MGNSKNQLEEPSFPKVDIRSHNYHLSKSLEKKGLQEVVRFKEEANTPEDFHELDENILEVVNKECGTSSLEEVAELFLSIDGQNEQLFAQVNALYEESQALQARTDGASRQIAEITKSHCAEYSQELTAQQLMQRKEEFLDQAIARERECRRAMHEAVVPLALALGVDPALDLQEAMALVEYRVGQHSHAPKDIHTRRRDTDEADELGHVLERVVLEKETYKILTPEDFKERGQKQLQKLIKKKHKREP
jgi:hypothetical protein